MNLGQEAIDVVNQFTRVKMREDFFYRRIIPPLLITDDELDRPVDTNRLMTLEEIQDSLELNALRQLAMIGEPENRRCPF